jgi:hypothetical protein
MVHPVVGLTGEDHRLYPDLAPAYSLAGHVGGRGSPFDGRGIERWVALLRWSIVDGRRLVL